MKRTHPKKKKLLYIGVGVILFFVLVTLTTNRVNAPNLTTNQTSRGDQIDSSQGVQSDFDKKKHSVSDPASPWVVVNKKRPLRPLNYSPSDLIDVGNGQRLRRQAAGALQQLMNAAEAEGHQLAALSGYRSYSYQQTVYNREVRVYGQAVADSQSAKPGYSEHQTGFAVDVGGDGCNIDDCFGNTAGGKWVASNAHKYGFIIRYQTGKEAVTGYRAEPWHIRYVGKELATEMHESNIQTMEEFFGL